MRRIRVEIDQISKARLLPRIMDITAQITEKEMNLYILLVGTESLTPLLNMVESKAMIELVSHTHPTKKIILSYITLYITSSFFN